MAKRKLHPIFDKAVECVKARVEAHANEHKGKEKQPSFSRKGCLLPVKEAYVQGRLEDPNLPVPPDIGLVAPHTNSKLYGIIIMICDKVKPTKKGGIPPKSKEALQAKWKKTVESPRSLAILNAERRGRHAAMSPGSLANMNAEVRARHAAKAMERQVDLEEELKAMGSDAHKIITRDSKVMKDAIREAAVQHPVLHTLLVTRRERDDLEQEKKDYIDSLNLPPITEQQRDEDVEHSLYAGTASDGTLSKEQRGFGTRTVKRRKNKTKRAFKERVTKPVYLLEEGSSLYLQNEAKGKKYVDVPTAEQFEDEMGFESFVVFTGPNQASARNCEDTLHWLCEDLDIGKDRTTKKGPKFNRLWRIGMLGSRCRPGTQHCFITHSKIVVNLPGIVLNPEVQVEEEEELEELEEWEEEEELEETTSIVPAAMPQPIAKSTGAAAIMPQPDALSALSAAMPRQVTTSTVAAAMPQPVTKSTGAAVIMHQPDSLSALSTSHSLLSDNHREFSPILSAVDQNARAPVIKKICTIDDIKNETILFTGIMPMGMEKEDAAALAMEIGANRALTDVKVTRKITLLIVGDRGGQRKISKANKLGITMVTAEAFMSIARKGKSAGVKPDAKSESPKKKRAKTTTSK